MPVERSSVQRCSFCGRTAPEVIRLIAGPGVYICSDCVRLCVEILDDTHAPDEAASIPEWATMTVDELLDHLPRIADTASNTEAGLQDRVDDLRTRGISWARIGAALSMSRQSAWERFAYRERRASQ